MASELSSAARPYSPFWPKAEARLSKADAFKDGFCPAERIAVEQAAMRRSAATESEKQDSGLDGSGLGGVLPLAASEAVEAASRPPITRYIAHLIVCRLSQLLHPP